MTQDELALTLADKALARGFDPEAYIVKYVAENRLNQQRTVNLVEDSTIDEGIQTMLQLFVTYYNNKTVENLTLLLLVLRQILSELYNTCDTKEEKEEVKQFLKLSQNIII